MFDSGFGRELCVFFPGNRTVKLSWILLSLRWGERRRKGRRWFSSWEISGKLRRKFRREIEIVKLSWILLFFFNDFRDNKNKNRLSSISCIEIIRGRVEGRTYCDDDIWSTSFKSAAVMKKGRRIRSRNRVNEENYEWLDSRDGKWNERTNEFDRVESTHRIIAQSSVLVSS